MNYINNPITMTDYPDTDVIRVNDVYYMISTTMYFMPGGVILRSYDLINWEIASYIFDELDGTDSEKLIGEESNYGKGMWAASLRYHGGRFYVAFVSYSRSDTHLFVAEDIDGPWEHRHINEYFHDCSLLFDGDRVFIVSGNTNIRLTELEDDLSAVKKGGIDKIIISDDRESVSLGYEGAHFYKINGLYYITLIHWPKYNKRRTEAVFVSDRVDGDYVGKDVFWDDMAYFDWGIAQGGVVDDPYGNWYSILFQDSGAVGRVPVLVPVKFPLLADNSNKLIDAIPEFGENGLVPEKVQTRSLKTDYEYEPLFISDDFVYEGRQPRLKNQWQWNHAPNMELWEIRNKNLCIRTGKISVNPVWAQNTLTQRMKKPHCSAEVTVDASGLNDKDTAGLIALAGCFGMVGIRREKDKYYIVLLKRSDIEKPYTIGYKDLQPAEEVYHEEISSDRVTFKMDVDFEDMKDTASFYYKSSDDLQYIKIPAEHKLRFYLDHFTGTRFGLCVFSEKMTGGEAAFSRFMYHS